MCRLSWNLGPLTSWKHQGLSRPVMGLFYLDLLPRHIWLRVSAESIYWTNGTTIAARCKQRQRFLENDQRDAQFFSMYLFLLLTLYMFRAHRAHHQERQIVSIQALVAVTLCRWSCRVLVGSSLPTCTRHRVIATRGCIDTICLSWLWARCAWNM